MLKLDCGAIGHWNIQDSVSDTAPQSPNAFSWRASSETRAACNSLKEIELGNSPDSSCALQGTGSLARMMRSFLALACL